MGLKRKRCLHSTIKDSCVMLGTSVLNFFFFNFLLEVSWICYSIASVVYVLAFWWWGMWDLSPGPGIEPTLLASKGRFLTTGPPGKSHSILNFNGSLPRMTGPCVPSKLKRRQFISSSVKTGLELPPSHVSYRSHMRCKRTLIVPQT